MYLLLNLIMYLSLNSIGNFKRDLISHRTELNLQLMTLSAGLLPLLSIFIGFNLMEVKHLLVETEGNSEPMTKEEVKAVLRPLPVKNKEAYNHLNKTVKKPIQEKLKTMYGGDTKAVRFALL